LPRPWLYPTCPCQVLAPILIMQLRGLGLFLLFFRCGARRGVRIDDSRGDARRQVREAFSPWASGTLISRHAFPRAGALREGYKQNGRRAGHPALHRSAPLFHFGSRRAKVALQAASGLEEGFGVPAELQDDSFALPPAIGAPVGDGKALMGEVLTWLPGMLQSLELGDVLEEGADVLEDDSEFCDTARPWLHTKAFGTVTAPSQPEIGQELWAEISKAEFLKKEGGSLVLLLPTANNHPDSFTAIVGGVRRAAVAHINDSLCVRGFHPQSETKAMRAPVPLIQLFLDSPDLFVDGGSAGDIAPFL